MNKTRQRPFAAIVQTHMLWDAVVEMPMLFPFLARNARESHLPARLLGLSHCAVLCHGGRPCNNPASK